MLRPSEVIGYLYDSIDIKDMDACEKKNLACYIARDVFELDSVAIVLNEKSIKKDHLFDKLSGIVSRVNQGEPIQYIFGYAYFFGRKLWVDKNVLIPRPETEGLVAIGLEILKNINNPIVYDMCVGSGCIAITLAKELQRAEVFAIDICDKAIEIAKKNAKGHQVCINFITKNIFEIDRLDYLADVIISNPPYVRASEAKFMKENVLAHEPRQAIFVSDVEPLIFYKKIVSIAKSSLKPSGVLLFEINEIFGEEVKSLLAAEGFVDILIKKDVYNKDRFVMGRINDSTQNI